MTYPAHGTVEGYDSDLCRCRYCREAKAAWVEALTPPAPAATLAPMPHQPPRHRPAERLGSWQDELRTLYRWHNWRFDRLENLIMAGQDELNAALDDLVVQEGINEQEIRDAFAELQAAATPDTQAQIDKVQAVATKLAAWAASVAPAPETPAEG